MIMSRQTRENLKAIIMRYISERPSATDMAPWPAVPVARNIGNARFFALFGSDIPFAPTLSLPPKMGGGQGGPQRGMRKLFAGSSSRRKFSSSRSAIASA